MIINLVLGALYALSIFYKPIAGFYNLPVVAPLALAFSLATFFFGVGMAIGGPLYDKRGPKIGVLLGAILVGLGYITASFMEVFKDFGAASILYLVGLGVLGGLGIGFAYAVPGPVASKWFPDKTGTAIGVAVLGFGLGSAVVTPIANTLMMSFGAGDPVKGVFMTLRTLGILWFIILFVCALILKNPPAGWKPQGWKNPASASAVGATLKEALRDFKFYFLWLAYVFAAFAGLMVIGNAAPIVTEGLGKAGVSKEAIGGIIVIFLIIMAVFNGIGRPSWGTVLDKVGPWKSTTYNHLITFIILVPTASLFTLGPVALFALAAIVYFNYGGVLALYPSATASFFGRRFLGRIYGVLFTAYGVAGLTGALVGGFIRDITGSYAFAMYTAAVLSLTAAIMAQVGARLKK